MDYRLSENLFDRMSRKKNALIYKFMKGDISKREFLIENYELIQNMNMKPFKKVDCFEKGYFNYQYYNTMAKYYRMEAEDEKDNIKHPELYKEYMEKCNFYYDKKDKTILQILKLMDFRNVDAYYIKVKSTYLKNRLVEIVLKGYDGVVFHTRCSWLAERLAQEGILKEDVKKSVIDSYINQKY